MDFVYNNVEFGINSVWLDIVYDNRSVTLYSDNDH